MLILSPIAKGDERRSVFVGEMCTKHLVNKSFHEAESRMCCAKNPATKEINVLPTKLVEQELDNLDHVIWL